MPDKRKSHIRAVNPRRRRIGIGARRPFRPSLTLPAGPELPAEDLPERFGRHSIGIKELRSIEMVREWAGIVFRAVDPDGQTDQGGDAREQCEKAAAGDFHDPIRPQNSGFSKGPADLCFKKARLPRLSLTFRGCGALTPAIFGKTFFSTRRPAREAGGQRPTARCALGRKSVWFGVLALRQHILARHHPPPGLAFGEPDDRLQRAGMTAVTDDLILRSRAAASRRMGNDTTSPFETQAAPAPQGEAAGRLKCSTICRKSLVAYSIG